ncbi:hypothetical protein [Paenibacillus cellulositrophicus]|uniref:hypothetical protein n=1 Tax=Paenibacillus cellulositrophicus TaxID=562959 RepID=UPI00142E9BA0|nr:hypothetical protein [Paenibacillus cellulositrophicus]
MEKEQETPLTGCFFVEEKRLILFNVEHQLIFPTNKKQRKPGSLEPAYAVLNKVWTD